MPDHEIVRAIPHGVSGHSGTGLITDIRTSRPDSRDDQYGLGPKLLTEHLDLKRGADEPFDVAPSRHLDQQSELRGSLFSSGLKHFPSSSSSVDSEKLDPMLGHGFDHLCNSIRMSWSFKSRKTSTPSDPPSSRTDGPAAVKSIDLDHSNVLVQVGSKVHSFDKVGTSSENVIRRCGLIAES